MKHLPIKKVYLTLVILFFNLFLYTNSNAQRFYISTYQFNISSIPSHQVSIFPESVLNNNLAIGNNRAKICWYIIDPSAFYRNSSVTPPNIANDIINNLSREVYEKEIYPDIEYYHEIPTSLSIFNVAYYPKEKGPYNFDLDSTTYSAGIDSFGFLNKPETRWGGLMRGFDEDDRNYFRSGLVNYLAFWLMDPFVYNQNSNGGELIFQFGDISEDILKDDRLFIESDISLNTSAWGFTSPLSDLQYWFSYQNEPNDVGFDGLSDSQERSFHANYINGIKYKFGINSLAYQNAYNDISNDNADHYLGNHHDAKNASILQRYKNYNNSQGNTNTSFSINENRITSMPDIEDFNINRILDTTENYAEYKINLTPQELNIGQNYIRDKITTNPINNDETPVSWYKFLIPLDSIFPNVYGNFNNIDSSKFMRIILRNFSDTVILRLAYFSFVNDDINPYPPAHYIDIMNPNPANETVYIESSEIIESIGIYDLLGRKIYYNNEVNNNSINLNLTFIKNNGLYLINLKGPMLNITRKLFIQH